MITINCLNHLLFILALIIDSLWMYLIDCDKNKMNFDLKYWSLIDCL